VETVAAALGGLVGRTVLVMGASYRGGVKEVAFSGVWSLVKEITERGGSPLVHDPLYNDQELAAIGLVPWDGKQAVDGAIVQSDHAEYRGLGTADLPGARVVYDGRGVLDPDLFDGVALFRIGRPSRA
jgi:UDP-N-acetyl-D-mannosaminuronate dehydrogenase